MKIIMIGDEITDFNNLDEAYLDRGLFFGDGVYEALRSYDGHIFGLDEHLLRFKRSLDAIEIDGVDIDVIRQRVERAYAKSGFENAKIYFHITRGSGIRQHVATGLEPRFFMTVEEIGDSTKEKRDGIKVITTPDTRWARCDIKTLNLLPNVLAKRLAVKKGVDEAIFVNTDRLLTEGSSSAFFAIFSNNLQTTPLSANILPSITRKFVIEAAQRLNLTIIQENVKLSDAPNADEMFIAVSSKDIIPIVEFDGLKINDGKPGKITKLLITEFANIVKSKTAQCLSKNIS